MKLSSLILSSGVALGSITGAQADTIDTIKGKIESICAPSIDSVTINLNSKIIFSKVPGIKKTLGKNSYPVLILIGKDKGGYSGVINYLPYEEIEYENAFSMSVNINGTTSDLSNAIGIWGGVIPTKKGTLEDLSFGGDNCTFIENIRYSNTYDNKGKYTNFGQCIEINGNGNTPNPTEFLRCVNEVKSKKL